VGCSWEVGIIVFELGCQVSTTAGDRIGGWGSKLTYRSNHDRG
jgi:hypothetical protein